MSGTNMILFTGKVLTLTCPNVKGKPIPVILSVWQRKKIPRTQREQDAKFFVFEEQLLTHFHHHLGYIHLLLNFQVWQ